MSDNNHKQIKDSIIKTLYLNRGQRALTVSGIRKLLRGFDLKSRDIKPYLLELISENLICKEKGKTLTLDTIDQYTKKTKKEKIPGDDRYYLSPKGIDYYDNDNELKTVENPQLNQLVESVNQISGILSVLVSEYKLSSEEQQKSNELINELKEVLNKKGKDAESKTVKILKNGLDYGTKIFFPLMVEYIKSEAKQRGIIL